MTRSIDTWTDGPTAAQQREAVERMQERDAMARPTESDMTKAREIAASVRLELERDKVYLAHAIAAALAAERARVLEECAATCAEHTDKMPDDHDPWNAGWRYACEEIAAAIRHSAAIRHLSTPPGGPQDE